MSRLVSRRKTKKDFFNRRNILLIIAAAAVVVLVCVLVISCQKREAAKKAKAARKAELAATKPATSIEVDLLTPNKYSRPQIKLKKIKGIVVHYTANPGATAMDNRNYFEGLKTSHRTHASSHFVIGLDGEIIQCVPTKEIAYASNNRNYDTLSIECCHAAKDGRFEPKTYASLIRLCAYLCHRFNLKETDIIRHYDVTGKNCPKYFVEHPKAWKKFLSDVKKALAAKDWNLEVKS
ncbi:MAG: N-acetylmuramoyl-L-alanine amidase [Lachnospiraceae bacterium]|uniref:N-acetylmuramoyl-L-alanine amidase n=1 Tax=Candidatus Weimeria bifida TaxID=2599074 RepID=A0A6N7IX91_9FIRM|nr:N-acetylmuramoyl-L-alanine amidase [Candidatus Weimeria bifida]RRF97264.1 MAG: N-acetylmuramoyl-L-alanine amidase [Lachnospiraceae bacterium]